jgi:hypothetical protein
MVQNKEICSDIYTVISSATMMSFCNKQMSKTMKYEEENILKNSYISPLVPFNSSLSRVHSTMRKIILRIMQRIRTHKLQRIRDRKEQTRDAVRCFRLGVVHETGV